MNGSSTSRNRVAGVLRLTSVLAVGVGATIVTCLDARAADRSLSQYIRDRWATESGFPGGAVHAITQTSDGYLWIAAEKGLVRFDGLTFRLFTPGSDAGIGRAMLGVAGTPDGSLWARPRGAALYRFHEGAFENILPAVGAPESVVTAMLRGRDGAMFLATLGRGAAVYRGRRFESLATTKALPSSSFVVSMAEASDGDVWLGTRDAGLLRVRGDRITRVTEGLPDLKINCLLAGNAGEVWVGTDKGVVRWDGAAMTTAGIPSSILRTAALDMIRDRESAVWIAAGSQGLFRVSRDGAVRSASAPAWPLRHVATVFEDRDGNLWVGTDRGLERWRDPVFTTYSVAQGMPAESIGPVFPDDAGRVWFAPSAGGLFWIQNDVVTQVKEAGLSTDVVYSIHGSGGEVWVARQRGGVTRLRLAGEKIAADRFTHRDGLAQDSVFAIHRARDGAVWAGTLTGGASVLRDGRFSTYGTSNGLTSNTVASILQSRDGTIWFATPNGLSAFSRGAWRTYVTKDGLPSNDVNVLYEDHAGVLWVGTAKGIAILEGGQLKPAGDSAPALQGTILGLAEDRRGSLWLSVVDRVLRVDRERLLHGALDDGDVKEYGVADGLLAVEAVKRNGIVAADGEGRIWFGLTRGLSVADPARADHRSPPALTAIESVTADGAAVDLRNPARIPSGRRRLAFDYQGLSLSVPERVRYRYRLDGFDNAWNGPVSERQAVYTNLTPGPYRFRVVASNGDGLWSEAEASVPFEITPMFWQTAWFQVSAFVLAGLSTWGIYRLRVRQVAGRLGIRFEERLAERTRIAQELHDTLLQGFISASMQLHVAVDRLSEDSPEKSSLARVLDLMGKVIEEGRNAVRGLRSSSSAPHDLEQAFAGVQKEVAGTAAAYRVIVEGQPRSLNPIVRDEVYRIGREGLVNAFHHSGATRIELELEYGAKELSVFVRDDGRGIDPHVAAVGTDGHWGLTGMRERARRIRGDLKIRSRVGAGTEVELRVPADVAFEPPASPGSGNWRTRLRRKIHGPSSAESTENSL